MRHVAQIRARGLALAALVLSGACGQAVDTATVAVASNFRGVAAELARDFESGSPHRLRLVGGSTGKLYAQIVNGAPFDVFLAADEWRPRRLEDEGLAVAGSGFTYATGRLCLWSADPARLDGDAADLLRRGDFRRLAIANPDLAPYGRAAREALEALDLWDAVADRLVMGENIGQAHALVATGNADIGLVALPQVGAAGDGCRVPLPESLHEPIRQRAVLLEHGAGNRAARAFLAYLGSPAARALIAAAGYAAS